MALRIQKAKSCFLFSGICLDIVLISFYVSLLILLNNSFIFILFQFPKKLLCMQRKELEDNESRNS